MNYLVTGGTGFIGTALIASLGSAGHTVTVLTRRPGSRRSPGTFVTSLDAIPAQARFDGVVNLAGASLAGARWSASYKREIISSRLATTESVISLLGRLQQPPAVLLSASAIGMQGITAMTAGRRQPGGAWLLPGSLPALEAAATAGLELGTQVCTCCVSGWCSTATAAPWVQMARPFGSASPTGWATGTSGSAGCTAGRRGRLDFLLQRPDLTGAIQYPPL